MDAKKIPGFVNLNLQSMYIPQEVFGYDDECGDKDEKEVITTPLDVVMGYRKKNQQESKGVIEKRIEALEQELEVIMESNGDDSDGDDNDNEEKMERVCNEISALEDQLNMNLGNDGQDGLDLEYHQKAAQVLTCFGITKKQQNSSMGLLSGGQKKKVLLACTLFCDVDVLLLDGKRSKKYQRIYL